MPFSKCVGYISHLSVGDTAADANFISFEG